MNKLVALVLAIAMVYLISNAEAIVVGPYNVTVELPGYNDIQTTGPIKNSDARCVVYHIDITKGNGTMPSEDVHVPKILVRILRYNIPINIDDPATLAAFYDAVAKETFSAGMYIERGVDMIDGREAASWQSPLYNYRHITYFMNNNVLIDLGAFDLPSKDLNILLRTFHVQEH